jgi:hypothetical protein
MSMSPSPAPSPPQSGGEGYSEVLYPHKIRKSLKLKDLYRGDLDRFLLALEE